MEIIFCRTEGRPLQAVKVSGHGDAALPFDLDAVIAKVCGERGSDAT